MVDALLNLMIFVVVLGGIYWVLSLLPIPAPFDRVLQVIMVVILVIVCLKFLIPMLPR